MKVTSDTRPENVKVEKTFDGKLQARLTENVVESSVIGDDDVPRTQYNYDEFIYETDWSDSIERQIRANPVRFLSKARATERYKDLTPEEILARIEDAK